MFDRNVVRRRRAVLAILVVVSLVLLTASFGGGLGPLQRGADQVLSPIESGASVAAKPFRDLAGWFGDVFGAKGENKRLKKDLAIARRKLAATQLQLHDAGELAALDRVRSSAGFPQDATPITARVIARSPTVWYSAVQVNKGRGDGVAVDQPVITGDGLAGKVTSVTGSTARVTLVTDASSAVSAQVAPDGAKGVVKPEVGNARDMLLDFIEKGRTVSKGDTVVSAGATSSRFESLFPRGIPIGQVRRVETDELELYQRVHLRLFADLREMDYVQILETGGAQQQARAGAP